MFRGRTTMRYRPAAFARIRADPPSMGTTAVRCGVMAASHWRVHVREGLWCPAIRRRVSSELRTPVRGTRCPRAVRVSISCRDAREDAPVSSSAVGFREGHQRQFGGAFFDPLGNTLCCRAGSFPVRCANAATSHSAAILAHATHSSTSPRRCRRVRRVRSRSVDRWRAGPTEARPLLMQAVHGPYAW